MVQKRFTDLLFTKHFAKLKTMFQLEHLIRLCGSSQRYDTQKKILNPDRNRIPVTFSAVMRCSDQSQSNSKCRAKILTYEYITVARPYYTKRLHDCNLRRTVQPIQWFGHFTHDQLWLRSCSVWHSKSYHQYKTRRTLLRIEVLQFQ